MRRRASSPAVVGRDAELAALEDALAQVGEGGSAVLLLVGEAGIGKTRLVQELTSRPVASGFAILRGDAVDLAGAALPYDPIVGALERANGPALESALGRLPDEARAELARLLPGVAPDRWVEAGAVDEQSAPARLFRLLGRLLRELARDAPTLLVIEDLHWADESTLDFLAFLVRSLPPRLGLLLTVRAEDVETLLTREAPRTGRRMRRFVAELARNPDAQRFDLQPLERDEVAHLLQGITGRLPAAIFLEEICTRSNGIPYHAEELLATTLKGGDLGVPATVRDSTLIQIEGLNHATQDLLKLMAVASRPVNQAFLQAVGLVPEPTLTSALHEAMTYHLIRRAPGTASFSFRHALGRQVVYDELLPQERSSLHAAIAAALADAPDANPGELALHWHAACRPKEALAASTLAATMALDVFAYADALAHLERVLELWDRVDEIPAESRVDRVEVISRAARAAFLIGEHDRSGRLWRQALGLVDHAADPVRAAELYEQMGRCRPWSAEESLQLFQKALTLLPPTPSAQRGRLTGEVARGFSFLERWPEARDNAEEALELALSVGSRAEEASARMTLGVAVAFLGDPERGERELRTGIEVGGSELAAEDIARAQLDLGEVLRLQGRFTAALSVMRNGAADARRRGTDRTFGRFMTLNSAEDLFRLGRWDETASCLDELATVDCGPTGTVVRESVAGRLAAARGDFAAAADHLLRAATQCREIDAVEFVAAIYAGLGELALWRGHPDEACRVIDNGVDLVGEHLDALHAPVLVWMAARAHADAGQTARSGRRSSGAGALRADVEQLIAGLHRLAQSWANGDGPPETLTHLALAEAELERATSGSRALERWEDAAQQCAALGREFAVAYARWRMAEAALAVGEGETAVRALRDAQATARELGARPLLGALERLARRADVGLLEPTP
jgi:tetratricopeptide (TPR) repeat protein